MRGTPLALHSAYMLCMPMCMCMFLHVHVLVLCENRMICGVGNAGISKFSFFTTELMLHSDLNLVLMR